MFETLSSAFMEEPDMMQKKIKKSTGTVFKMCFNFKTKYKVF